MNSKLTVMTCFQAKRKFGSAPRHYGYTLAITPPIEHQVTGQDVEGIGWVPCKPYIVIQKWQGWYKFRSDAERRVEELNKA